ncbi:hypothetical protein NMYAN_210032 [Nitrosomonas nitrosa]|uniref:Uncharacterized protein n=1 Tax=Nitrosomonas nitrosa TaxID=52442 RepID=A0A8H8YZH0_9PROT|nr:hypothetical protein NMYAN_210032 [Nitrosomonas nitrosa]
MIPELYIVLFLGNIQLSNRANVQLYCFLFMCMVIVWEFYNYLLGLRIL